MNIIVPPFATADQVDAIVDRIVGELHAHNERVLPEAIAQLRELIEAASTLRADAPPLHPHIAEEIVRLREMGYGVELLRNDTSTALIRMIGDVEAITVLIDIAQLNRGDTQH